MLRLGSHRFGSNRATHLKSPKKANGLTPVQKEKIHKKDFLAISENFENSMLCYVQGGLNTLEICQNNF